MESPRMYEEGINIGNLKKSVFDFNSGDHQPRSILDPALENAVDIQELLSGQFTALEGEGDLINIDHVFPQSVLDLVEAEPPSALDHVQQLLNSPLTQLETVPTSQNICMTNSDSNRPTENGPEGWQILTIKSEDLDLTSCQQSPEPPSPAPSTADSTSSSQLQEPTQFVYTRGKPGRKPSAGGPVRNRKRQPTKDTPEYYQKRARNNVAVRKSRDKAKVKQNETESRVSQLVEDNESLQKKVDLLSKELNVLKGLFINVGASLPANFEEILNR